MKKRPVSQKAARQRAEVIMQVRCGLMSASQAARELNVSRKTYYKWEQRGLSALLESLEDQRAGRPCRVEVDPQQQTLEMQLEQAHRDNALLKHKIELKDILTDLKLRPGLDRAKKK